MVPEPEVNGTTNGVVKKTRTVIHLSLCDTLFAYGPISGVTFSVAKNGV